MSLRIATILGSVLAFTSPVYADDGNYRGGYKYDNYRSAVTSRVHQEPVRLRLDYRLNGEGSVPLRKLIRDEYGINTRDYELRSVSVRSKRRRDACAELQIGHRSTGAVYLREGVTRIEAPRVRGDGRWTLHLADARVRRINVVLVPKYDVAHRDHRGKRSNRSNRGYDSGYAFNNSPRYNRGYNRSYNRSYTNSWFR